MRSREEYARELTTARALGWGRESNDANGELDAASPGELPGLEAFLAENRTPLCWLEGDRGLLTAGRARRDGFYSLASDGAGRTTGPLSFSRFTPLRFVL